MGQLQPSGRGRTTATLPAPARAGARKPVVHRWLRWPLRLYYTLITFVLLALLGNIAVVPLAQGTRD